MLLIGPDTQPDRRNRYNNRIAHDNRVVPISAQLVPGTFGLVFGLAGFLGCCTLCFVVVGRCGGGEIVGFRGSFFGERRGFVLGALAGFGGFMMQVFGCYGRDMGGRDIAITGSFSGFDGRRGGCSTGEDMSV